jgi:hypothetical protein
MVRAPAVELDLRCGGAPMVALDDPRGVEGPPAAGFDGGTPIGKRYVDEAETVELLCTKAGDGSLSIGEDLLAPKVAKPLPSSD